MCLIAFAYRVHPDYPLLLAANRDEYHARPSRELMEWPDMPGLFAGRDEQAGGTWMGVRDNARFAAITNHRNPPTTPAEPRSRGMLTLEFLAGDMPASEYLSELAGNAGDYAGFNLLLGDSEGMHYFSNIAGEPRQLEPGIYGVSNALLDTPWPKLEHAKRGLAELSTGAPDHDELHQAVSSRDQEPDERLPGTGVPLEQERMLSAQFILSEQYGTRATTSLMVHGGGFATLRETRFDARGGATGQSEATVVLTY